MKLKSAFVFFLFLVVAAGVRAQDVFSPYYVVIGGFRDEGNAQRFCNYAHDQNLPAVYAYNEERQTYYVYVRATQTREVAYDILKNLKERTVFRDAWVFNGTLSGGAVARQQEVIEARPSAPAQEPEEVAVKVPASEETPMPPQVVAEETPAPAETPKPVGQPFIFRLVDEETGETVNGFVRLQESERATQYRGFTGNEKVYVPAPVNRSGKWIVIGQSLGFKMSKKSLVYAKAAQFEGASVGTEDEVIIPLELTRVRRGDYIEMEGVKFYHNAALLTPGSERELDQLVAMMEENSGYQIRLHGHANGDQPRDIVSIGTSSDFFNPNTANAKSHSSAKELSLLRAELVKAYLVGKGIDASRISTKGEGGKQMIFDPRGTLAGMNDRVEVEVRKH